MLNQWFKFYGAEFLSDPKIASLTAQERSCWITLLAMASISTIPGVVEFLTVEVLLQKSGIVFDPYHPEEWDKCLGILKKFEALKMVTASNEGVVTLCNWNKRQESALTNAERQARYRERHNESARSKDFSPTNKESNEEVTTVTTKVTLDKIREDKIREDIDTCANCFARFWELYPLKKNKKKAEAKFCGLTHKLHEVILADLPIRKNSEDWKKDSGRFVPHPTTYLNGERWEDEIKQVASKLVDLSKYTK